MLNGFILDVHPNHQKDVMVTWLLTKKGVQRIEDVYHPSLYVSASSADLQKITGMLTQLHQVEQVRYCRKKTILGSQKTQQVLQVTPSKLRFFHPIAHMIDTWGAFHSYQLYNVDIRLPTRYLQEHHVFFNAEASWTGNDFILHDVQWSTDYLFPSYKTVQLELQSRRDRPFSSFDERIARIII